MKRAKYGEGEGELEFEENWKNEEAWEVVGVELVGPWVVWHAFPVGHYASSLFTIFFIYK